jgi:predicted enzyme related to lactoylglutathione lyase
MDGVGRLGYVQIDCADPALLAGFWSQLLGLEFEPPEGLPSVYVGLPPTAPGGPAICFQRVPEPKSAKNRLHFDVIVDDVDAATDRIARLGGSRLSEDVSEDGFRWRVMADPEGNEFCLIFEQP